MKTSKRTSMLVFSVVLLSAVIVPGIYMNQAKASIDAKQTGDISQFFSMFNDPRDMGSALGSMLGSVGGNSILGDVLQLMFAQVMDFNDREILPGQNVFVFNATASSSMAQNQTARSHQEYWTSVPFIDHNQNTYYVYVNRSYDVEISFQQEAQIVIILWDSDGSLIAAIRKLLAVVQETMNYYQSNPNATAPPQELISKAVEAGTWILIHINDIITGDEQIIFQPSYYWSTTYYGSLSNEQEWFYANNGSRLDPAIIHDLPTSGYAHELASGNISVTNTAVHDTGFMFHLFQLWLQRFQIHINMSKLSAMLPAPYGTGNGSVNPDMLSSLLEGIDIQFAFTQHHLLGGMLFNDTNGDGVPTVDYVNTGFTYMDSDGIVKNVTVPALNSEPMLYRLDIADPGDSWTASPPTVNTATGSIDWSVQFNQPKIKFSPIGSDDLESSLTGSAKILNCTRLLFGFSFKPTVESVYDEDGNSHGTLAKGEIKLNQEFGEFNNGSALPAELSNLCLAVVYFSHVFTFDLRFTNNATASVGHDYNSSTGTLDFLGAGDTGYFANVDIIGPNYTSGAASYAAKSTIIPFAFFDFTFNAERTIANDEFSMSQGEPAFRQQTLYVGITSAWAFYCVSYAHWNGAELIHDPTFSIFMTLPSNTPWGVILLVVVIGALVAGSIVLYFKKQGRF